MKQISVVAIVNYDDKILLGKKRKDSCKFLSGEWHIPGETVENDESDQEALIRGIKEEAGLVIIVGRYLGSNINPINQKEVKWYECFSTTDKVIAGSDLEDVKWIPRNKVIEYCSYRVIELFPKEIQDYFR
ncbi:MAG: NUDIX domain-containing protein [Candidatus Pacearchaeota archaeon]|jgi:ADP-ribose pyrophosphatase YjhB (NUDIX family)